jgi:hypothetical protein
MPPNPYQPPASEQRWESPEDEQRRAKAGRQARRFGWSAVVIFVVMTIFGNLAGMGGGSAAICCMFFVAFAICALSWLVLKALSLPG